MQFKDALLDTIHAHFRISWKTLIINADEIAIQLAAHS